MFKIIKLLLIVNLLGFGASLSYAQNLPRLCICFNEHTKYITIDMTKDSTRTSFSIVKEGYETKEKRKEAKKEWYEKGISRIPIPPQFYYNFFSIHKPKKITSINNIDDCVKIVTVDEYRQEEFKMPEDARSGLFIFIKKKEDGTYLKWNAMTMAIE